MDIQDGVQVARPAEVSREVEVAGEGEEDTEVGVTAGVPVGRVCLHEARRSVEDPFIAAQSFCIVLES